jgi:homoserine kinase
LLKVATQDKLHQEQRASLIPGMRNALKSAMTAGAYGAAFSGSGPTLIAFCSPGLEEKIASTMMSDLTTHGLESEAHFLDIDPEGVQVIPDYKS